MFCCVFVFVCVWVFVFMCLRVLFETDPVMLYGVFICGVLLFLCVLFMLVCLCVVWGVLRDVVWFVFCVCFCVCLRL